MEKARNQSIDVLRGIAIFLVIFGHCIQYSSQGYFDFFENKTFIFIYTFHMPLFMLISGYLFYNSCNKNSINIVLKNKITQILYPLVVFTIINFYVTELLCYNNKILSADWIHNLPNLWFLWSILASISVISLSLKITKNNKWFIFISILLSPVVYCFPNGHNNLFMYVFFLIGFLYNKYKQIIPKKVKNVKYLLSLLFIILLPFWNKDCYIYISGMFNFTSKYLFINQLKIDAFRFLIGIVGCIFIITIILDIGKIKIKFFNKLKDILINLGKYSLHIYLIQSLLIENVFRILYSEIILKLGYNPLYFNKYIFNILIIPIITVIFLYLIVKIIKFLEKKKLTKLLFGR